MQVGNKQSAETTNGNFVFEILLDSKTAAALLSVHWKTLQQLARSGQIPAHRIGNLWRFRASELDKWLDSNLQSGTANPPVLN